IRPVELKVDGEIVDSEDAAAVRVELTNGRTDYIINSLDPDVTYTVDDSFSFKGFFGVYPKKYGEPIYGYLNDGTVLGDVVQTKPNALTGTVVDFTKDLSIDNQMTVDLDQSYENADELVGS